jgi:hypothetical protein
MHIPYTNIYVNVDEEIGGLGEGKGLPVTGMAEGDTAPGSI